MKMDAPNNLFIDTSIYRGAGFNYDAIRLAALVEITQFQSILLLLPETTLREMDSHFKRGLVSAEKTMRKALSSEPMLRYFLRPKLINTLDYQRENSRVDAWQDFAQFTSRFNEVLHLGYEYLNIHDVQDWRSELIAPFSERKKNEYSDGMTLSILLNYAKERSEHIAVVSEDDDWRQACERYKELEFYPSALAYSEHRDPEVEQYVKLKLHLKKDPVFRTLISKSLTERELEVGFGWDIVIHSLNVNEITNLDFAAISNYKDDLTAAISVEFTFNADVEYDHVPDGGEYPIRKRTSIVSMITVDGMLLLNKCNDGNWYASNFTPELERYELF